MFGKLCDFLAGIFTQILTSYIVSIYILIDTDIH